MTVLWIVLGIAGVGVVLLLAAAVRAALIQPTPAKRAAYDVTPTPRALALAERLSRLVQMETVSCDDLPDQPKFHAFHDRLAAMYPRFHAAAERTVLDGSLLFRWPGRDGAAPAVLLLSHHDVVEASGDWTHPPFSGTVADGRIWGRGTLDTKASLLCILEAVEQLAAEGYVPACDVYVASSCTEETNGHGARLTAAYLKERGVRLRVSIDEGGLFAVDPMGGVKGLYAMVGVLEKGYGDLKFTATSGGGHSSTPGRDTPVARLAAFVHEVETHRLFRPYLNDTLSEMLRRMAPNSTFPLRLLFANQWLFRPLLTALMPRIGATPRAMTQTTCVFTTMRGSNGYNVIPQEAYVTANLRYAHHQDADACGRLLAARAKKHGLRVETVHREPPCKVVDFRNADFRRTEDAIHGVCPDAVVVPYPMTGGTDSRYYNGICDCSLRFVPLYADAQQLDAMHGIDENLYIQCLDVGVTFFVDWIRKQTA